MAAPVPLSTLRTVVRELANMETTSTGNFISSAELDRRINEAVSELYDLLLEHRGQDYYARSHPITTVAGTALYALPADFYQLLGVSCSDGSSHWEMQSWQHSELPRLLSLEVSGGWTAVAMRYRMVVASLELRPAPSGVYTVTVRYVPTCTLLVNPTDTFDGVNGWEKWACLRAAIDLLSKEESDTRELRSQLTAMSGRIAKHAGNRDAGQPARVTIRRRPELGSVDDLDEWGWA